MSTYLKVGDVADLLEVAYSTITKYYSLFEKNHYRFRRNNQGDLMFSDDDVKLFRKLIQLKNTRDFTVEKAVLHLLEENLTDKIDLTSQIQILITERIKLEKLTQQYEEIIKMQQEQGNRIEELYKLHMKSLKKIEELIKENERYNQKHTYSWGRSDIDFLKSL
ncbi:MerR family transcriptional regulator [Priestia endophytica]|uniref:MerR family transcriptional regulator n=1 Tax=Priestia endophytica TaxID=135735 RepID=UPI00124D1194|nr:MerR family transcriptional regulator [Priestia endophytica]KAB2489988.1 MerR family transcriptional regulator [Priestia endophytica]